MKIGFIFKNSEQFLCYFLVRIENESLRNSTLTKESLGNSGSVW